MKFNRSTMLDTCQQLLADHEAETATYEAAVAKWRKTKSAEQSKQSVTAIRAVRDNLNRVLKRANPILTRDDVAPLLEKDNGYRSDRYLKDELFCDWSEVNPGRKDVGVKWPRYLDTVELRALIALLEGMTDDEVSQTALSTAGFKRLDWLYRAVATNGGAA